MRLIAVALATLVMITASPVRAQDALAEAKIAADLGNGAEAERMLEGVAADAAAPAPRRGEALVRLGALRRGRGDVAGAAESFRGALTQAGSDAGVLALLMRTIEGVSPDDAVVQAALGRATLREDAGRLELDLGGSDASSACTVESEKPVTLSLQDGEVADAAWLIAEAAGLPVVLAPCLWSSEHRVSVDFRDAPAGHALRALVRCQGLRCARQGKVLIVSCADAALPPETSCARVTEEPISISTKRAAGGDIIGLFGAFMGTPVLAQECVRARQVSVQLSDVPAADVLCALARANAWTVEVKADGLHVSCAGDPGTEVASGIERGKQLDEAIAGLALEAGRHLVVSPAVRGGCGPLPEGEPAAALDALLSARDLRLVDCGGVSAVVPAASAAAAAVPAGVPGDFPSARVNAGGNSVDTWSFARALARATDRLLLSGCRPVSFGVVLSASEAPAGPLLDAWCRAQGLKLRASGPALFAWQPPCDGPKGDVLRASARDRKVDLAVKGLLAPHVAAALNLLGDKTIYVDVRLREKVLTFDGTWPSTGDAARALAAALGTEANWSDAHDAWLVGPADAVLFGDGFRRYAVRADGMPLSAWLELVRPFVGWPVTTKDGIDLSRPVPLADLHRASSAADLIQALEHRTPYHVDWDGTGLVVKP